jgi:hypothetical protein
MKFVGMRRERIAGVHCFFSAVAEAAGAGAGVTAGAGADVAATGTGATWGAGVDTSGMSMSSYTVQNHCRPPGCDPGSKK